MIDDSKEDRELWDLLGQRRKDELRKNFADDVLRQARVAKSAGPSFSFWKCLIGGTGLAACGAFAFIIGMGGTSDQGQTTAEIAEGPVEHLKYESPELVKEDQVAEVADEESGIVTDEIFAEELLFALSDVLDEFSDEELAMLAGF